MILEGGVLFRIQHFKQCSRRITAEVHAHFVDFIEQENRINRSSLLDHLNNLPGKCADIRPAMAANLRLITNTAQSQPHKLAACSAGDGHPERSLTDARRSDEAEDRTFRFLDELPNGEKLENAVFNFLESVMILIQNLFGNFDIADLA